MANQKWVEIRHPKVQTTAVVAEVSLPHHRAAGWEVVESADTARSDRQPRRPQNRPQPAPNTAESEGTS